MPFDWTEYARLAEELRTRGDEASLRSAISRAYYSVYHQARDYLDDEGIQLSKADSSHKIVWRSFKDLGRSCRAVWVNGDRLNENRTQADYEREIPNIQRLVEETFEVSERLLVYLEQCKASRA